MHSTYRVFNVINIFVQYIYCLIFGSDRSLFYLQTLPCLRLYYPARTLNIYQSRNFVLEKWRYKNLRKKTYILQHVEQRYVFDIINSRSYFMFFFPLFMGIVCLSSAWLTHVSLNSVECVYTNLEMYNFFLIKFVSTGANYLQYLRFLYICVNIFLFHKRFC
jgi:hypothetical protein